MRRTRFMSLLFLVWSVAFFFVPDFRQALQGPILGASLEHSLEWLQRAGALPRHTLEDAIRKAEAGRDAKALAFASMHPPGGAEDGVRLAGEAVALDPQFTWIFPKVYLGLESDQRKNPDTKTFLKRLEVWDPDNAVPYLFEGGQIMEERGDHFPSYLDLEGIAQETEWRGVMQKAFAAPRYDSYVQREFDLERQWLLENNLAKPATVLLMTSAYPIPNLMNIRMYSNLLVKKLGKEAEAAGHEAEAMSYYWTVAHMGERMHLNGMSLIEKLIGAAIEKDAYDRLIPLLRRNGQADQAASLQFTLDQQKQDIEEFRGRDPLTQSINYNWAVLIVGTFLSLAAGFGVLTVLAVVYVNAKRWVRPEKKGRLYQLVTVAENYLPILWFLACLGLYLSYYPYAQNFHHYMTATGATHNIEPLFHNLFPTTALMPGDTGLPLGNPFAPYAWYALGGLALVILVGLPLRQRAKG